MNAAHDKILVGTERGSICVYHTASLQLITEVPYQLSHLINFSLNAPFRGISNTVKKQLFGSKNMEFEEED